MLEVKVTITLAPEVLNLLSGFAGGIKAFKPEHGKIQSTQKVKTSQEPKQNVNVENADKEESNSIDTEKPFESSITIEEIRAITAKAAKKDKPTVKELLTKFGAKSVSTLVAENYQAFYEEVKELV